MWLAAPSSRHLGGRRKNTLRVQDATLAAQKAGIRNGMSAAAARALIPDVETELLNACEEQADLEALSQQLLRVSPSIAAMPPIRSSQRLHRQPETRTGHERVLTERVRIRMNQLGHAANIAVADDPNTAFHIAQWRTDTTIIPPGQGSSALAPLPLSALSIPHKDRTCIWMDWASPPLAILPASLLPA